MVIGDGPAASVIGGAYDDAGGAGPTRRIPTADVRRADARYGGAAGLDVRSRTVTTASGQVHPFDACVIATGTAPVLLPVPGGDDPDVRRLRTLTQARGLGPGAGAARSAVVVGSGFVGCEAAVWLAAGGITVTQASKQRLPQLGRLGEHAGRQIAAWLAHRGVTVLGDAEITRIDDGQVYVKNHEPLEADLVVTAVGVRPQVEVAAEAGLDLVDGRVVADEHLRTSAPGVWAAGEVAWAANATAGRRIRVELADDPGAMGVVAGTGAAGGRAVWDAVPCVCTDLDGLVMTYAGWGEPWDTASYVTYGDDSFSVFYERRGATVAVLAAGAEDDLTTGLELVTAGRALPARQRALVEHR